MATWSDKSLSIETKFDLITFLFSRNLVLPVFDKEYQDENLIFFQAAKVLASPTDQCPFGWGTETKL